MKLIRSNWPVWFMAPVVLTVVIYLAYQYTSQTPLNQPQTAPDEPQIVPEKPQAPPAKSEKTIIDHTLEQSFHDLDQIRKKRELRVLVEYSKTNFFFDRGQPRGFEFELLKECERELNQGIGNESDKINFIFLVRPFDQLLQDLNEGRGDLVAANLTITPERARTVNFSVPYLKNVNEIVVHNKDTTGLEQTSDLSGKAVHVLSGSSFEQHLKDLNHKLVENKQAPVQIMEVDNSLSAEDILELINAGIYQITLMDDFSARPWRQVMPDIRVREDLVVSEAGQIAWAVRKTAPKLLAKINRFIKRHKQGSAIGNILFRKYYANSKWVTNPTSDRQINKFRRYQAMIKDYADRYNFDWLTIAATAYQESGFDQSKKSHAGAIGIMQVLPSTARSKSINIPNIKKAEHNIHAGVKYLAYLRDRYFSDLPTATGEQINFSLAAYNAGPAKIARLRKQAAKQGYDQNKWFQNVERIAAQVTGQETVRYVANIKKYYIAYRMSHENQIPIF